MDRLDQNDSKDAIGSLIQSLDKKDWKVSSIVRGNDVLLHAGLPKGTADASLPSVVVVDKGGHRTHVLQMQEGQVAEVLSVVNSVGKLSGGKSITPSQEWFVHDKRLDPVWHPPKSIGGNPVAPFKHNPHNPIGLAFIRLGDSNHPDGSSFGLHGTNAPAKLGKFVSHGCVRHDNKDILKIYPLVKPGTVVYTVDKFEGSAVRLTDFQKR